MRLRCGTILAAVVATSATLPAVATTYTSASYVQDGLITQWDGIDNAGTGTHNPNATVWKDLKGDLDLTLNANGSWTNGNALSVNGMSAQGAKATAKYFTIEIVFRMRNRGDGLSTCIFHSGWGQSRYILCYEEVVNSVTVTNKFVFVGTGISTPCFKKPARPDEIICASAIYGSTDNADVRDLFADGERSADGNFTAGNWPRDNRVSIGERSLDHTRTMKGEVYTIRLYSRQLTKAELAHNNKVDRQRFITSASYAQDGLIAQWDGENNAGTGVHNPNATVWKDLKGNLDLTLIAGHGGWNAYGNAFTVSGASAIGESPAPAHKTIEVAYRHTNGKHPTDPTSHNQILINVSDNTRRQLVWFSNNGANIYFSGLDGPTHYGIGGMTFNSNIVHTAAGMYTNSVCAATDSYLDATRNRKVNRTGSWSATVPTMLIGDNRTGDVYRPWYGDVYSIRMYDRILTTKELATHLAIDQKRIFAPRVMQWANLADGNFCSNGNWTVTGVGGQKIPRYSDRVTLPAGDYAVALDEDWTIGELSMGAGAGLQFALPSDSTVTNVVRLTVFGKVEADAAARLVLDSEAFGKAYKEGSMTLLACDVASPSALQNLARNVSFVGGRHLGRVDVSADGKSLVYTAVLQGTMIYFK
jgi:hypothetical protein